MNTTCSLVRSSKKVAGVRQKFGVTRPVSKTTRVTSLPRNSLKCEASVGVYFGSVTGNTGEVADMLSSELGADEPAEVADIADDLSVLLSHDCLCIGAPTWNTGADSQRTSTAWDDVLEELAGMDFSGKKVAVFGCGDSSGYSDYFCDGLEELYTTFEGAGATMCGNNPTAGYEFEESKSCVGGPASSEDADSMVGLAIDVENQSDMTEERVEAWTTQLKGEFGL